MRRSCMGFAMLLAYAGWFGGCARQEEVATMDTDTTRSTTGQPVYGDTVDPGTPAGDPALAGTAAELMDRAKVKESDLGQMIQANRLERADDLAFEISGLIATAVARGNFRTGQRDSLQAIASSIKTHAQALADAATMGDVERSKDEFRMLQDDLRTAESRMGPNLMM